MAERNQVRPRRKHGWKQWTPAEARQALAAWRKSGLSLGTFARQQGIGPERLRWWRNRMKSERLPTASKKREPPAQLVPAVVTAPLVALGGAAVSIRFPAGAVVEIASVEMVSPDWVGGLLAAVARSSR